MKLIGAKLVLTCAGSLLTCLRDDFDWIPWPAHWDLPGGGAEPGESPTQCALRELHEEFGLTLAPQLLRGRAFPSVTPPGGEAWMFHAPITQADIAAIRFGDEGQEWRMMPIAEFIAHPRAVPHFRQRVPQML
ncbi:NUDIX hydrolase [Paracoccus laeviglucosivorans]|uniref:8-oxo-dGTP diphosphatase n=1 Tax=Paracoccus laeviglucosivorans TaxID=1197861 RepID=A0A521FR38_9RHOB|nr:NUDIX hydrolase [Paracoccus laeviglucosivorans]SMO98669.1 8-oxo-dGTP diphosphatase [Paracoccus laeviglucosivorans]